MGGSSYPRVRDPKLDSAQIGGDEVPGVGTSSSASPGFGSWTQVDANRPAQVVIAATAETDGSSNGDVRLSVDESGGSSADYTVPIAFAGSTEAASTTEEGTVTMMLPAGAQYKVVNNSDPNSNNNVDNVREFTL